ncbi:Hypothetical_protein [Hexamita inflata]|uniref:Hypothetical_protein n=1 Tax=Hexamita inflata TaxID=28002 RepID=A0ABP1M0Z8_9EUKA
MRQGKRKPRDLTKNQICSLSSGQNSISVKTYIKNSYLYPHIKYMVRNNNESMIILTIHSAKKLDKDAKLHLMTFSGEHQLFGPNHCHQNFSKRIKTFSKTQNEIMQKYIYDEQNKSQEIIDLWL